MSEADVGFRLRENLGVSYADTFFSNANQVEIQESS